MSDVFSNLREGLSLLLRTKQILLLRMGVYAAFFVAGVVYFSIFGGIAWLVSSVQILSLLVMVGSLAGAFGLVYWARRYIIYMIQAAHIAIMTELLTKGELPASASGQFDYGKTIISDNVKDLSILFTIDALVDGILRAFTRTIANVARWIPLPGVEDAGKAIGQIINRSLTYVDEAILSYGLTKRDEQTLWQSAYEGVVLYGQAWKPILKTAVGIWLVGVIGLVTLFALYLIPGILLGLAVGAGTLRFIIGVMVILGAYLTYLALYEPLGLAAMLVCFHKETRGMTPDPEWERRIESAGETVSSKFRELKQKADQSMQDWQQTERTNGSQPVSESPASDQATPDTPPNQ